MKTKQVRELAVIERNLRNSFAKIREELDDHLNSINQNTSEIQVLYDMLANIEKKVDKLSERIEEMQFSRRIEIGALTFREQELFMVLYTAQNPLSISEMAEKLGFSEEATTNYINSMILKGVPIIKKLLENRVVFFLENSFRELQARENLVLINEQIIENLSAEKIL